MTSARTRRLAALAAGALLVAPASAPGQTDPSRTFRLSTPRALGAEGPSFNPSVSSSGRYTAFDSVASNLTADDVNGPGRDVFVADAPGGVVRLASKAPDGGPADGPSSDPVINAGGGFVAYTSGATNLVAGDFNAKRDVFLSTVDAETELVSAGLGGANADGSSSEPDMSLDGRFVAFTSTATNLVEDDTNGKADIFVRDTETGTTRRVSVGPGGLESDGPSRAPAISPDGRVVSFSSTARNLVEGDTNRVGDVFVHTRASRRTERVSVSTAGVQQNRAVTAPFAQVSDVGSNGRYVVFDSDATNLVPGDGNRRTDVFLYDRTKKVTRLQSENRKGFQGDNDSFFPAVTPDGRFIVFTSFATNLASNDVRGEDVFVRDTRRATVALVNVGDAGQQREREDLRQLLQRPTISQDGAFASFVSTADNLVPFDLNGTGDVFLRVLRP